jgi:IS5 family transposase
LAGEVEADERYFGGKGRKEKEEREPRGSIMDP